MGFLPDEDEDDEGLELGLELRLVGPLDEPPFDEPPLDEPPLDEPPLDEPVLPFTGAMIQER